MICTQCGREIPDGSLSCNYCGKIFVGKRAPADNQARPGSEPTLDSFNKTINNTVVPQQPKRRQSDLDKSVSLRHAQRYIFYGIFVVLFLASLGLVIKFYNDANQLSYNLNVVSTKYKDTQKEIETLSTEVESKNTKLIETSTSLSETNQKLESINTNLSKALEENKKAAEELNAKKADIEKINVDYEKIKINIKNIIGEMGIKISLADLNKILPAAVTASESANDADKDGLPDALEMAFGTDPLKPDTDGDAYNDIDEINKGFNPLGQGKYQVDQKIVDKYKGKFALETVNSTEHLWYVSMNGQRYYLGNSDDNYAAMRASEYWTKQK